MYALTLRIWSQYKQNTWVGATLSVLPGSSYLDEWGGKTQKLGMGGN